MLYTSALISAHWHVFLVKAISSTQPHTHLCTPHTHTHIYTYIHIHLYEWIHVHTNTHIYTHALQIHCLWIISSLQKNLNQQELVLVTQMVKNPPAIQETWVQPLGRGDALEKRMATHSSILAWRMPWTEEPGGRQSVGLQSQTWLSNCHIHFSLSLRFEELEDQRGMVLKMSINRWMDTENVVHTYNGMYATKKAKHCHLQTHG